MSLILERKINEGFSLFYGDVKVNVAIEQIKKSKVLLRVKAPDEVRIIREDIKQKMKEIQEWKKC
jgi:carbon storage regulator CsrA